MSCCHFSEIQNQKIPSTMASLPTSPPPKAATFQSPSDKQAASIQSTLEDEHAKKKEAAESVSSKASPSVVTPSSDDADTNGITKTSIYLLYDERMTLHQPLHWKSCEKFPTCNDEIPAGYTFENPERIRRMHERLLQLEGRLVLGGPSRLQRLSCQPATQETILLAHSQHHYDHLQHTSILEKEELAAKSQVDDDIYYCPNTFLAATLACGGVVSCVDSVMDGDTTISNTRAVALVRPPGHHACQEKAMGERHVVCLVCCCRAAQQQSERAYQYKLTC